MNQHRSARTMYVFTSVVLALGWFLIGGTVVYNMWLSETTVKNTTSEEEERLTQETAP